MFCLYIVFSRSWNEISDPTSYWNVFFFFILLLPLLIVDVVVDAVVVVVTVIHLHLVFPGGWEAVYTRKHFTLISNNGWFSCMCFVSFFFVLSFALALDCLVTYFTHVQEEELFFSEYIFKITYISTFIVLSFLLFFFSYKISWHCV